MIKQLTIQVGPRAAWVPANSDSSLARGPHNHDRHINANLKETERVGRWRLRVRLSSYVHP